MGATACNGATSTVTSGISEGLGVKRRADRVEIGQSVLIEFGVDGGKLGLAGSVMGERQQPDHCAARLLLAGKASKRVDRRGKSCSR